MSQRSLEIIVQSAKGIKKVTHIGKMDVYVIIAISGGKSKQEAKTPIDVDGGSNPAWNFKTIFTIDEAAPQQNIVFKVKCERALGDKDIGEVHIPIKELLQSPEANDGMKQSVSYQVRQPHGKPKGSINFDYQFGKKVKGQEKNTMAYPPPPPHVVGSSSAYPPPGPVYPPPEGGYQLSTHSDGGVYPPPHSVGVYPPPKHSEGGYYPPHSHSEGGYPPQPSHYQQPPTQYDGAPIPQGGYPRPPPQYAGYGYPQQPGYGYAPPQPEW